MRYGAWLVALTIVACKTSDDHASPPSPPELQVVSAGSEPRRVFRYHAVTGTKQTFDVAIDMSVTAGEMGGPLPTLVMTLGMEVEAVLKDGRMKLRTVVAEVAARDRYESRVSPASMTGPLQGMKGLALTSTLSPGGRATDTTIDAAGKQPPDSLKAQLAALTSSFEGVMMPLPVEPIGVGAVWRSSKPVEQAGMKMKAVNTITLTAIDGDRLAFTLDTHVHGDDQTVKQGDLVVEIKDITGTGTGKGSIDLATLSTTSELSADFRSEMLAPDTSQPMPMRMEIKTTVTPR